MREQGSPFLDLQPSILVASGPQDERAIALVQTLRKAGLRVIFGETVTLAARAAGEAAACVAVLRPDTWKCQTIATMMRAKPDCLIPVLAESMTLPRGPWTRPAISLAENAEQAEQELIQALRDYLATRAAPTRAQRKQNELVSLDSLRIKRLRPRRRKVGAIITTLVLLLLIVGLGGLLAYRYYPHQSGTQITPGPTSPGPSPSSNSVYNASVPGPDCDLKGGQWEKGERYIKTVDNKKVEVIDKYTTLQCQANGALLSRSGDYDVYSELFFDGPPGQATLAPHYLAQVDATIIDGDAQASITMDAHIHGYGRYNFDVNTLGHWEATTGDTVSGEVINHLAIGFLPQKARTYLLAIDVDGPSMMFFINGKLVTTVADTTYTDNNSVAFGVNDGTAKKPISALFSNFQYEVLPAKLTSAQAVATATMLAQSNAHTPYSARVPGYICDKGAGQWQPPADNDNPGTIHCQSNGMQLTDPANTSIIAEEDFYWLNGHFPQNYKVSAKIDVSGTYDRCAGLGTRESSSGSYGFVICSDGSWAIVLLSKKFQTLFQGMIYAQGSYTVTAESNGAEQSLYIDGNLIKKVKDSHLTKTDAISLDVGFYRANEVASATFTDFTFTPLP